MSEAMSPKRALALYREALERGDFDTVAAMLWLAERDPALERLISEFHEAHDAPPERRAERQNRSRGITENVRILRTPSPNGWPPKPDNLEEENDMNTTHSDVISRGKYRFSPQFMTALAAALIFILLGSVIIAMVSIPVIVPMTHLQQPTPAPLPAGCQTANAADAQAESVRLAQASETALQADSPDSALATLLAICALQTSYTPEADVALQKAMALSGAQPEFKGDFYYLNGLAFSPDGQTLYSGSSDQTIRYWNVQSGEQEANLSALDMVFSITLSSDGRYLVTGNYRGTAKSWDVETQTAVHTFSGNASQVISVALSPDGQYLLTGSVNGSVLLWNFATGERLQSYKGNSGVISPDGQRIATLVDGESQVHIFDLGTDGPGKTYETVSPYTFLAFSDDGRYLLGGQDTFEHVSDNNPALIKPAILQLLDVQTGAEVRRFEGHTGEISSVQFSRDDRLILSTAYDGTARLWDVETGQQLRIFTADEGEAMSSAMSPDGRRIAVGYESGLIKMWDADYHDMIARACAAMTRDFTPEERTQFAITSTAPTCPQFGENYILPPGMTPIPTQPIPVWTPLPTLEETPAGS
jgi:WD40 domain-containing protein